MNLLYIVLGVTLLYLGGELLVRGASRLALALGLSPLVIGLTVVAFGTSTPELAASLSAAACGSADIAFGNVVGSNIANLAFILGLTALFYPLVTTARFIKREVVFMLLISAALLPLLVDRHLARLEGLVLAALLIIYIGYSLRNNETPEVEAEFTEAYGKGQAKIFWSLLSVAGGVALLVGGAQSLVSGAVAIATSLGVPERIIGLTLVAVGTSLPELASSLVAAFKRESDIVLGNLIGSNIFNILAILGVTALVQPIAAPHGLATDLLIMLGFSVLVIPFLWTGLRLSRVEGSVFLLLYVGYVGYLFLA